MRVDLLQWKTSCLCFFDLRYRRFGWKEFLEVQKLFWLALRLPNSKINAFRVIPNASTLVASREHRIVVFHALFDGSILLWKSSFVRRDQERSHQINKKPRLWMGKDWKTNCHSSTHQRADWQDHIGRSRKTIYFWSEYERRSTKVEKRALLAWKEL
jgi:hypothetical protein